MIYDHESPQAEIAIFDLMFDHADLIGLRVFQQLLIRICFPSSKQPERAVLS